jgi:hypothetical protein
MEILLHAVLYSLGVADADGQYPNPYNVTFGTTPFAGLMNRSRFAFNCRMALIFISGLLLSACNSLVSPQPTVVLEQTAAPPATATTPAPLVLLVSPPQADPALAFATAELAAAYAAGNQMRFEQRALLDPAQVPAELSALLLLAPDPGAAALAAAAPQAQIIAIGFSPESAPNLVALPLSGGEEGSSAFIAGYVAALTAEDWRAAMLYTPSSASWVNDFVAGAEYFCGACIPIAPPDAELPLAAQAADAQSWQAAAEQLLAGRAQVVYLAPELEASEAAQYLASFGVLLIGSGEPLSSLEASWLASISTDPIAALREQLPLTLAGQAPAPSPSLVLTHVNSAYLSEARLADVQEVIEDLLAGFIRLPAE